MSEFRDLLNEQLKDPEFKKEWDDIQPEMDVIRAIIDNRIAQNLTQKELAERTGQSRQNLSNKMARDNFTEREAAEIAVALNCTFSTEFKMNDTEETI